MAFKAKILVFSGIIFYLSSTIGTLPTAKYKKVCQGTSNGLSYTKPESRQARYRSFKQRYEGCVSVDGNLEITNFNDGNAGAFSFLRSIEEVTGYVLIATTYAERIPLTGLRIVRGRTLFRDLDHRGDSDSDASTDRNRTRNYSLYVAFNYRDGGPEDDSPTDGLAYLIMPNLTEISAGSVLFHSNARLCFLESIDWTDILSGEAAKAVFVTPKEKDYDRSHCDGECPARCQKDVNQTSRHCWTKRHCQNFTRNLCAAQCSGRCFGRDPNQCCHTECAAGCNGSRDTDCYSCKNFVDEGRCVPFCPQITNYDLIEKRHKPNPNAKFTYGSQCVKECPKHMMVSKGACVSDCGRDHYANESRICVECHGQTCPISCQGTGDSDWVNAENIKRFENCSLVKGCLKIQETTFTGDKARNIRGLNASELSALKDVVEITDYLTVDSKHPELRSLSFLKNLRVIQGRNLDKGVTAFKVIHTNLESLGLDSLREVRNGRITVGANPRLCFAGSFNWTRLLAQDGQTIQIVANRNDTDCEDSGLVCSAQCSSDGCMGPEADQCFGCSGYRFGRRCIGSCADHSDPHLTPVNGTDLECVPCHENCRDSCRGTGEDECDSCRYRKDGTRCVRECPAEKYADTDGVCLPCSPNCDAGGVGGYCLGPDSAVSPTGCKTCRRLVHPKDSGYPKCLSRDEDCPQSYYKDFKSDCRHCHDECLNCSGYGASRCQRCRGFEQDGVCVASCSPDHYAHDARCRRCHEECLGCHGPTADDCSSCRLYTLYEVFEPRSTKFSCTKVCPEFATNKLREGNSTVCVSDEHAAPDGKKLVAIIVGTICGIIFLLALAAVILVLRRQVARAEEEKLRITAKMSGIVECEPLTPSNVKPNMAVLRLIKESDIRQGGIIGSGAFGTVYKGLWVPDGENVKIPVAIKVLQDGAGESANILEEARIMASVVHPSCLHVLAVCLTAQVMLVSQLMPLGCLLDYVRKHRDNIGSKVILNWCTQIARGMSYLEERGIIHRDLAARNVLVHSSSHVKITDFGLAKLVDEDGRFLSTGGKLPIKWLALECIRNRIFTHKSDVWSFGVTVWELCTYGRRPYENVNASDIVDLLEKGERLPQPSICTIDVYMIMIKCWMLGAESRPSFAELAEEFAKMARDPGRYLVIPNDKLMRLPSQPVDFRELLRNVSLTLDGPEEVITADDYVNEKSKRHGNRLLLDKSEFPSPIDEEDANKPPRMTLDGPAIHGPRTKDSTDASRETAPSKAACPSSSSASSRLRPVPRLEIASQNRLTGDEVGRGESPRYSPDPCSLSYQSAFPSAAAGATEQEAAGRKEAVAAATESMRLALDHSDYLQPKSSLTIPAAYLELVDYSGTDEFLLEDSLSDDKERASLLPRASSTSAVENPEYFQPTKSTPLLRLVGTDSPSLPI